MDLNRLREQLQKSRPVRVTRTGELQSEDGQARPQTGQQAGGPSRIKRHTFADGRMTHECELMRQHTLAETRIIGGDLAFEEEIDTNFGVPFRFRMIVPADFPQVAPRVYCLSPDVPKNLDFHTYADGRLCLMMPGEWSSRYHLLDVRNWYCEWAFNVVPRLHGHGDWMSPEHA